MKVQPMRAATQPYLVHKTHLKQKALTLRIPVHVHNALNSTRESADAAGFVFDVQTVVVQALERALEGVALELQALASGKEGDIKAPTAKVQRTRKARVTMPVSDL